MINRLSARLKFLLERALQRGIWHQVLVMAVLIFLVAVTGGLIVWAFGDQFESPWAAIWWSFLRLTDPGYLGDDEGALMRTVSTVVTILGYVLFMGSLIAIMTQWLARTMRQLESGTTPIAINGHILILGWTNRTPEIVEQILCSTGRLKRFLRRQGAGSVKIVILAEDVSLELTQVLRERIGRHETDAHVIFRSGSSLRIEHLRRVDLSHAAAVIVPGADFEVGGWELGDTRIIKILLSISQFTHSSHVMNHPSIVAELFDGAKIPIARNAMSADLEIIASGNVIGGMVAQSVRNPGLSHVYDHLFSRQKPYSLHLRPCPELAGRGLLESLPAFPGAVPIGVVRNDEQGRYALINVPGMVLQESDLLVFLATRFEDCVPARQATFFTDLQSVQATPPEARYHRFLILGWSHKIFALIEELDGYGHETFQIDIISRVSAQARERALEPLEFSRERIRIHHLTGDYTAASVLEKVDFSIYESLIFMASDNLDTAEQADARTVLAYVLTRDLLKNVPSPPQRLLELMDGENAHLFDGASAETIVSPRVLSHLLAHIAMRRELAVVYNELFGPEGADIVFRSTQQYGLEQGARFDALQQKAAERGEIIVAVASENPDGRGLALEFCHAASKAMAFEQTDRLVVLTSGRDRSLER